MVTREDPTTFTTRMCAGRGSGETGLVMNVLSAVLDEFRYIPYEALEVLAKRAAVPMDTLEAICARSDMFSTEPVGDHVILLCDGTVCHMKGASEILLALESLLKIKAGQTTLDRRFTLKTVKCLGTCSNAPVMILDKAPISRIRLSEVPRLIEQCEQA